MPDAPERRRRRRKKSIFVTLVRRAAEWLHHTLWYTPINALSQLLRTTLRSPARLWRTFAHGAHRFADALWEVCFVWPLKLVAAGRKSASLGYLLGGLPALLLLIGVLGFAALVRQPVDRATQYYLAGLRALAERDYETSRIYHDRLLEIQGPRNETLFNLTQISEQLGDQERFVLLMNRLAPLDKLVHGPAHLKKANLMLAGSGANDPQVRTRAETHLRHALRDSPNSVDVHAALGNLYLVNSEPQKAIAHLEKAIVEKPDYLLLLAQAYALTGDTDAARKFGMQSQTHFQQLSESRPTDSAARIDWARSTSFLEDFPQAIEILQRGIATTENDEFRQPLFNTYMLWFDHLTRQDQPDQAAMLAVLQKSLDIAPNEAALFERVLTLLDYEGKTAKQLRSRLTELLAQGENFPLIHLILGTDAGKRGDFDLAVRHLEISVKMDPAMLVAANNLAWYLAHRDPPDLDTAFSLISTVAKAWPENAYVLDTRGQILARQGRYEEALIDLKKALAGLRDYRPIHVTLSEIYNEMGMAELAAEHKKMAQQLASEQSLD